MTDHLSWFLLPYFTLIRKNKKAKEKKAVFNLLWEQKKKVRLFWEMSQIAFSVLLFSLCSVCISESLCPFRGRCTSPSIGIKGSKRSKAALKRILHTILLLPEPCESVSVQSNQFKTSLMKGIRTHFKHLQDQNKLSKLFPRGNCFSPQIMFAWYLWRDWFFPSLFFNRSYMDINQYSNSQAHLKTDKLISNVNNQ